MSKNSLRPPSSLEVGPPKFPSSSLLEANEKKPVSIFA